MVKTALLGLGGNIGDPPAAMRGALGALEARADTRIVAVSRLYRTPPWGKTDQPWFYNACAAVETELSPRPLLDLCLDIERILKRERRERWGPRTIDIDVLDHGGERLEDEGLSLPHPRMKDRAFVLVPLAEIAPDYVLDGVGLAKRVAALDGGGMEAVSTDGTWWRATG